jgi:hypothetical protein
VTRHDVQLSRRGRRLKKATRDLTEALGGPSDAAKAIRQPTRQPRISTYCSHNCDAFAPIDLIAEMQDAARGTPGHPHVTRALAYEDGFELFKLPDVAAVASADWASHLACIAQEAGDVMGRLGAALADKKLVAAERGALIPDARELVTAAVALLTALESSEDE